MVEIVPLCAVINSFKFFNLLIFEWDPWFLNTWLPMLFLLLSDLKSKVVLLLEIQVTLMKIIFFQFCKYFTLHINHLILKQNFVKELRIRWVFKMELCRWSERWGQILIPCLTVQHWQSMSQRTGWQDCYSIFF